MKSGAPMSQGETSPAPSASSRGLKRVFSKHSRTSAANSVSSDLTDHSVRQHRKKRVSVDSAIRMLRPHSDEEDGRGVKRLSKLIPGMQRKKRHRKPSFHGLRIEEDSRRGRSFERDVSETRSLNINMDANDAASRGRGALDDSLISYDEPHDHLVDGRPSVSTHNSHAGYLTASSPLITTTHTDAPGPDLRSSQPSSMPLGRPTPTNLGSSQSPRALDALGPGEGSSSTSRRNTERSSPGLSRLAEPFTADKTSLPGSTLFDRPNNYAGHLDTFVGSANKGILAAARRPGGADRSAPLPKPIDAKSDYIRSSAKPSLIGPSSTPPSSSFGPPQTTLTPPTPTELGSRSLAHSQFEAGEPNNFEYNSDVVVSPSGNMISHRRVRSASAAHQPGKIPNTMTMPLTPTIEEAAKASGPRISGMSTGGFFSSVLSAAQNALSLTGNLGTPPRSRSGTQTTNSDNEKRDDGQGNSLGDAAAALPDEDKSEEKKRLAIETLGTGDLSLSHLGFEDSGSQFTNNLLSNPIGRDQPIKMRQTYPRLNTDGIHVARAVSAAYANNPDDNSVTPVAEDFPPGMNGKSSSLYSVVDTGGNATPNDSVVDSENSGVKRTSSVRSRLTSHRRDRASSTATASAIASAITVSSSTLANPTLSNAPRLTGFAVASKKRNRDFHQLFRSVPEDDYLIEDYSCALQREIILAGRLYISEGHICFSSNILGWVTTLVISFDEIVSVEKESTAVVFPNAIAIQTLHARHTFRSLLSRDSTYDLIIGIWKISHPGLKSSANGMRLEGGVAGDKMEKADESIESETSSDIEEEVYDEDEEEGPSSFTDAREGSIVGASDGGEPVTTKAVSRKPSALAGEAAPAANGTAFAPADSKVDASEKDFPGPATHAPTECGDQAGHFDKVVKEDTIAAPLGKVYSLLFGPASGVWMYKWLTEDQKCMNLQMDEQAKKGLTEDQKSRDFSYIKPLNGPIGPKQTKCLLHETLDVFDLEKCVTITANVQTPDVPSGNAFTTRTKYCFTWAPGNTTRLSITCTVDWSAKSWLKGPIEKGCNEGQIAYATDLFKSIRAAVSSHPRGPAATSKKGKHKRGKREDVSAEEVAKAAEVPTQVAQKPAEDWGLLEPLRPLLSPFLSPIFDILRPLIPANITSFLFVVVVLMLLMDFSKWRMAPSPSSPVLPSPPERIAAYEEMWRIEENLLWDWMEDRTGLHSNSYLDHVNPTYQQPVKTKTKANPRKDEPMEARLARESMSDREVREAIRLTQERLNELKRIVDSNKPTQE